LNQQVYKILAAISSVCILFAAIAILVTPPAAGYELSVYNAFPFYFWIVMPLSIICGILLLIVSSFSKDTSYWWLAGLGLVIFSNCILLGLPFFRGYGFWPQGDGLTHIGMMKDIITTNQIGAGNFYPVVHLMGVSLIDITGLSEAAVSNLIFIFWSIVYLTGTYLLATEITNNRGKALIVTACACPMVFSGLLVLIHPSIGSILFMPVLFYFYFKAKKVSTNRNSYILLAVLLGTAIVFMHPVTCIFAVLILATFNIGSTLFRRVLKFKYAYDVYESMTFNSYNLPSAMFLIFCLWYFSSAAIQGNIRAVYEFLAHANTESLFSQQVGELSASNISTWQTISLIFYKYGAIAIYFALSILALLIILRMVIRSTDQPNESFFTFSLALIVAFGASAFSLWGFTGEFDPLRVARFPILIAPVLIGLLLAYYYYGRGIVSAFRGNILFSILIVLIIGSTVISVFNIYGSTRTVESNLQVTRMQLDGTKWFSTYQNRNTIVVDVPGDLRRCEDYNFGFETRPFDRAQLYRTIVPTQFGYNLSSSLAENLQLSSAYMLTNKASRINIYLIPENVRMKAHDYGGQGFAHLMMDPTVELIYSNGEFEAWKVSGK
jgi:hypothetical protein